MRSRDATPKVIYVVTLGGNGYGYAFAQRDAQEKRFNGTFKRLRDLHKFMDENGYEVRLADTLVQD